ncbi:MAG: hypothetical protein IKS09_03785, partial [Lachnospiraceae bacterium]|nr:hypothetical protein [Lachnospiraceae bacterium]
MIVLKINREENEYDLYAMVTSFYPEHGIKVEIGTEEKASENKASDADDSGDIICASLFIEKKVSEKNIPEKSEQGFIRFCSGKILEKDECFSFVTSAEDPAAIKKQWKLFLYDSLSAYTGRTLPWGALTGVRPTKLIMGMLLSESGQADTDDNSVSGDAAESAEVSGAVPAAVKAKVEKELYDRYRVSGKKAELGIEIATLES